MILRLKWISGVDIAHVRPFVPQTGMVNTATTEFRPVERTQEGPFHKITPLFSLSFAPLYSALYIVPINQLAEQALFRMEVSVLTPQYQFPNSTYIDMDPPGLFCSNLLGHSFVAWSGADPAQANRYFCSEYLSNHFEIGRDC